jgi:transposase
MERTEGVVTFVGIDAHSVKCSIKAISRQGEDLLAKDVCTSKKSLQKVLKGLPAPVWAMVESSTMAPFVKECLVDSVDRIIVCETRENRWIARSENKGDQLDADRLCRLLRMGEFKEVHTPLGLSRDRREVLRLYQKSLGDVSRTKNRIKGKYREHGVKVSGKQVYSPQHRAEYQAKIKSDHARFCVEALYKKLETDEAFMERLSKRMVSVMSQTREYKKLMTIPGVGKVVAAIFVAVIDDPWRFSNKRKLWSYSALGLRSRWSSDPSKAQVKGTSGGNRLLKYAALTAANATLLGDNPFSRHYKKMVDQGTDKAMAKRTVARKILATALAMLKNGTEYQDDFDCRP